VLFDTGVVNISTVLVLSWIKHPIDTIRINCARLTSVVRVQASSFGGNGRLRTLATIDF